MFFNSLNHLYIFNFLLLSLLLNFFMGCDFSDKPERTSRDKSFKTTENKSGRTYHPTNENIPNKGLSSTASFRAKENSLTSFSSKLLDKLISYEELAKISAGDNKFNNPFPPVDDIVIDNYGHFLILSNRIKRILVYNNDGKFVTSIGREGRGPGEFMDPKAIDLNPNGDLYVLDKFEVDIFNFKEGQYIHNRVIEHRLNRSTDLCLLNEDIVISGFSVKELTESSSADFPISVSEPLHLYNKEGDSIQSFGKKYNSSTGWPIFTGQLSEMYLACHDSSETVMTTYVKFPFIHGYSKSGTLKWVSKINDFSYLNLYEKSDPVPQFGIESSDKPVNVIEKLVNIGNGYALLQIGSDVKFPNKKMSEIKKLVKKYSNISYEGHSTFLVNFKTGNVVLLTKKMDKMLGSNKNYYLLEENNNSMVGDYETILKIVENF